MKKLMITCLMLLTVVFMWGCKSVQPTPGVQDPNFDKIQIFHKGKLVSVIEMRDFIKICYNSIELEKIMDAEENGRLYVTGDDEGNMFIIWEDADGVIIKELRIKI